MTHRTLIRRQLRSARVSALSEDERRAEMRAVEARSTPERGGAEADGAQADAGAASPRTSGG